MDKVSADLLEGAFNEYPHDVYMTYDELTDELIIRLIDPKKLAYVREIENNDMFALLIECDSKEIVGFHLFNFEKGLLQTTNWAALKEMWNEVKRIYGPGGYKKFRYDPKKKTPKNEICIHGAHLVQEVFA